MRFLDSIKLNLSVNWKALKKPMLLFLPFDSAQDKLRQESHKTILSTKILSSRPLLKSKYILIESKKRKFAKSH